MGTTWKTIALVTLAALGGGAASPGSGQEAGGGRHLDLPQVEVRGERGPTLLLLHCAGCGWRSWETFMEANEDRFRMVAPTLPGYAGSPRPDLPLWSDRPVFQDNALRELSELLDSLELTDVTVVGQSFGGAMAARLATLRPDAVARIVNVDGSVGNPVAWADDTPEERLAHAKRVVDDDWAIRLQDPAQWQAFNGVSTHPSPESALVHHGMFMASDRISMVHYWRENMLVDRNPELRALDIPVLDVRAIRPWWSNPDSIVEAYEVSLEALGPPPGYRRVVLHETTHWVQTERPRVLGTLLERFVAGEPLHDLGPFRLGGEVVRGAGPRDVVLLTDLTCDAPGWDEFMARNQDRYRMVGVTWPGTDGTDLPDPYEDPEGTSHLDYLVEALERLVDRHELARPVVIAHGYGSTVALRFAAEHPELVGGVVSIDPRGEGEGAESEDMPGPYRRDVLRTDTGLLRAELRVPLLVVHGLASGDDLRGRLGIEARYPLGTAPPGARLVLLARGGRVPWESRPETFDGLVADFVLGDTDVVR